MLAKNNPLNIRYSVLNNWKGQDGYYKGFVKFRYLKYGIRAAFILLSKSYVREGRLTIRAKLSSFAPRCENPTDIYIKYICDKCHFTPDYKPVCIEDYATLIYYMWCFEQGSKSPPTLSIADIEKIISDYDFING